MVSVVTYGNCYVIVQSRYSTLVLQHRTSTFALSMMEFWNEAHKRCPAARQTEQNHMHLSWCHLTNAACKTTDCMLWHWSGWFKRHCMCEVTMGSFCTCHFALTSMGSILKTCHVQQQSTQCLGCKWRAHHDMAQLAVDAALSSWLCACRWWRACWSVATAFCISCFSCCCPAL